MCYHAVCKIGTSILAAPDVSLFSTKELFYPEDGDNRFL